MSERCRSAPALLLERTRRRWTTEEYSRSTPYEVSEKLGSFQPRLACIL